MMINIFLYLLGASVVAMLYNRMRFQKFIVLCGGLILATIGFVCLQAYLTSDFDSYSYLWLTSKYYPVSIDFSSSPQTYSLMLPLFAVATLNIIYMLWDTLERRKTYLLSLTCLNLAFFIMLICAKNTIQILVSACFIDVLGFCVINNVLARRQYIFYNLLADMALFISFAMIWGTCRENSISQLSMCLADKNHFAIWLIVFATYIKIGLFPLQEYLMQMSILSESRRNMIGFLSTPIAGLFILYKLRPLVIPDFEYFNLLEYIAWATLLWGAIGALMIRRLADKNLYLNMLFYGLAYAYIIATENSLSEIIGVIFVLHFCLNNSLTETRRYFSIAFIVTLLLISCIIMEVLQLPLGNLQKGYMTAVILSVSGMLSVLRDREREENHPAKLLFSGICAGTIFYFYPNVENNLYYWIGGYLLLAILNPYRNLQKIYQSEKIQTMDAFSQTFRVVLVEPIYFLGRILLLTIDFLLIERTFLNSLSKLGNISRKMFNLVHTVTFKNILLFALLGILIIMYSAYGK